MAREKIIAERKYMGNEQENINFMWIIQMKKLHVIIIDSNQLQIDVQQDIIDNKKSSKI